jgi:hypothetical protein
MVRRDTPALRAAMVIRTKENEVARHIRTAMGDRENVMYV